MATKNELKQVDLDRAEELGLHPRRGEFYSFETVSPIYYGRLVAETTEYYHLEDCSWICNTGTRNLYVQDASNAPEVEYIGDYCVLKTACIGLHPHNKKSGKLETK